MELIEALSNQDIDLIKQHSSKQEISKDDVFVFRGKFIDDNCTANNRIWTKEWQSSSVNKFVGIPVLMDHENSVKHLLGRVFQAEFKENAIHGKVYVPLDNELGKNARRDIQSGLLKNLSINAKANNTKEQDGKTYIYPSPDDRIYELSFVAVPGCSSCGITKTEQNPHCKGACSKNENVQFEQDEFYSHALALHLKENRAEFIRACAFALGNKISKETYTKIAEQLDPMLLKTLTQDMKQAYEQKQEGTSVHKTENSLEQQLETLKRVKGY